MKREILFRGKRCDSKEWIYGYYVLDPENRHRIYWKPFESASGNTYHFVIPETVGQLRYENKHGRYFDGDVYYHAGYGVEVVSDLCELQMALITGNADDICHIQGNIHDNPELLKP